VGLSPDGFTLYWAETLTARLRARAITGPGQLAPVADHGQSTLVCGLPGHQGFDSLAVDAEGNICVATLLTGGVTVAAPDGSAVHQLLLPEALADHMTTNLCFGGPDLTTAYLTLGSTGRLVACPWPVAGLPLAFSHGSIPPAT
jgi:gluconolactonase